MYYKVTVVVDATKEFKEWGASCDETFGIASMVGHNNYNVHMIDYHTINPNEYDARKNDIFTRHGGI